MPKTNDSLVIARPERRLTLYSEEINNTSIKQQRPCNPKSHHQSSVFHIIIREQCEPNYVKQSSIPIADSRSAGFHVSVPRMSHSSSQLNSNNFTLSHTEAQNKT